MSEDKDKPKVLIVDDIPANIKALAVILKDDYQTLLANSGEKALEAVSSYDVDLILLDVEMPGMDGYAVLKKLKEKQSTADIPVIFVTGQNEEKDETRGLELGASDYIRKPASNPILKARIKNHIISKKRKDALEKLSIVDGLTGVANRRHFDQFLEQEWRRAVRSGLSMAVILMDIDHFKLYNDHLGHAAGDECLKKVAQTLKNTLQRSTDLLARYGGEEFVAVLPQVEHAGGATTSERLLNNIASLQIPHPLSTTSDHVTISVGCASMMPTRGSTPQPLVEAADKMLYTAKYQGRNQVKITFL
ncbi:MAG: diguanylate cyclase [Magnetococcales bacterium]|nr:diguanylate cyclase [Magnetococcales bacterium]